MDVERFTADVTALSDKMTTGESADIIKRMDFVRFRLIELYKRNIVKINHSAMELVCARHLIRYGYAVDVERQLNDILICDLYATKGEGAAIVEIETGFIPPEHALDPLSYYSARVASKIARYSKFANQFVLATPPVSVLPIPRIFRRPPRDRAREDIIMVKELCDKFYRNPIVSYGEILNSHLHMVYIINVDQGKVTEMDVDSYFDALGDMISSTALG